MKELTIIKLHIKIHRTTSENSAQNLKNYIIQRIYLFIPIQIIIPEINFKNNFKKFEN